MKKNNHITAYINDETLAKLKAYAQDHRWSVSTATAAILEDFLRENTRPAPAKPAREPDA